MNPPETAPKDRVILADFGWPWILPAHWNDACGHWATITLQCGPLDGEWNDTYFEPESENEGALLGWLPMPDVARR